MVKKETKKAVAKKKPIPKKKPTKGPKLTPVNRRDIVKKKLTLKQELFCQHYVKNDTTRQNATSSYDLAFGMNLSRLDRTRDLDEDKMEIPGTSDYDKAYHCCSVGGSRLMTYIEIQERNRELLRELLSNDIVDSKLSQHIQSRNGSLSMNGIKEYNKMNGRGKEIVEHTGVSEEAKAETYKKLGDKIEEMKPDEVNTALQDLLN